MVAINSTTQAENNHCPILTTPQLKKKVLHNMTMIYWEGFVNLFNITLNYPDYIFPYAQWHEANIITIAFVHYSDLCRFYLYLPLGFIFSTL